MISAMVHLTLGRSRNFGTILPCSMHPEVLQVLGIQIVGDGGVEVHFSGLLQLIQGHGHVELRVGGHWEDGISRHGVLVRDVQEAIPGTTGSRTLGKGSKSQKKYCKPS